MSEKSIIFIKIFLVPLVVLFASVYLALAINSFINFGGSLNLKKRAAFILGLFITLFVGACQAEFIEMQPSSLGYWFILLVSLFWFGALYRGLIGLGTASIDTSFRFLLLSRTKVLLIPSFVCCLIFPSIVNRLFFGIPHMINNLL